MSLALRAQRREATQPSQKGAASRSTRPPLAQFTPGSAGSESARAEERRIVMHPADYVSASFRAQSGGRVGRSFGCPALDPAVAPAIIDRIQNGSVVYVAGLAGDQRE